MPAPAAGEPGGGFDGQLILPGLDLAAPGGQSGDDAQLDAVAAELAGLDGDGSRMAAAIRGALDMLLDGQHTGRYRWDQLHKSETLVPNHRAADQDGTTGRSASRDDADWIDFPVVCAQIRLFGGGRAMSGTAHWQVQRGRGGSVFICH